MPDGDATFLGSVVGPSEDGTSEFLQRQAQVLLIPGGQRGAARFALEENAADSRDLCHRRLLLVGPPHTVDSTVRGTDCSPSFMMTSTFCTGRRFGRLPL